VVYFRWAWLVTTSICRFLGINCLTIPYEKQQENRRIANGVVVTPRKAE
jgi:ethanolaminephosphotransferase